MINIQILELYIVTPGKLFLNFRGKEWFVGWFIAPRVLGKFSLALSAVGCVELITCERCSVKVKYFTGLSCFRYCLVFLTVGRG